MYEDKEGGVVCGMLDAGRWCTSVHIPELLFGCDLGGAQQQLKHRFWLVAACTADRSCRQTESSPDGWIVDTSGLKSKKIDDFRTNLEKKLDFSPDVSTYPTIGTAL